MITEEKNFFLTEMLLISINEILNESNQTIIKKPLDYNDILILMKSLFSKNYHPESWFTVGEKKSQESIENLLLQPLHLKKNYSVFNIVIKQPFSFSTSVADGGVIFEDPFYAILACYNFFLEEKLLVIPRVSKVEEMWKNRQLILHSLTKKTYKSNEYFSYGYPITEEGGIEIKPITIIGEILINLRKQGNVVTTLDPKLGLSSYVMYSAL